MSRAFHNLPASPVSPADTETRRGLIQGEQPAHPASLIPRRYVQRQTASFSGCTSRSTSLEPNSNASSQYTLSELPVHTEFYYHAGKLSARGCLSSTVHPDLFPVNQLPNSLPRYIHRKQRVHPGFDFSVQTSSIPDGAFLRLYTLTHSLGQPSVSLLRGSASRCSLLTSHDGTAVSISL